MRRVAIPRRRPRAFAVCRRKYVRLCIFSRLFGSQNLSARHRLGYGAFARGTVLNEVGILGQVAAHVIPARLCAAVVSRHGISLGEAAIYVCNRSRRSPRSAERHRTFGKFAVVGERTAVENVAIVGLIGRFRPHCRDVAVILLLLGRFGYRLYRAFLKVCKTRLVAENEVDISVYLRSVEVCPAALEIERILIAVKIAICYNRTVAVYGKRKSLGRRFLCGVIDVVEIVSYRKVICHETRAVYVQRSTVKAVGLARKDVDGRFNGRIGQNRFIGALADEHEIVERCGDLLLIRSLCNVYDLGNIIFEVAPLEEIYGVSQRIEGLNAVRLCAVCYIRSHIDFNVNLAVDGHWNACNYAYVYLDGLIRAVSYAYGIRAYGIEVICIRQTVCALGKLLLYTVAPDRLNDQVFGIELIAHPVSADHELVIYVEPRLLDDVYGIRIRLCLVLGRFYGYGICALGALVVCGAVHRIVGALLEDEHYAVRIGTHDDYSRRGERLALPEPGNGVARIDVQLGNRRTVALYVGGRRPQAIGIALRHPHIFEVKAQSILKVSRRIRACARCARHGNPLYRHEIVIFRQRRRSLGDERAVRFDYEHVGYGQFCARTVARDDGVIGGIVDRSAYYGVFHRNRRASSGTACNERAVAA